MRSPQIDTARLTLALNELRLPGIKALWPRFAEIPYWGSARITTVVN